MSFSAPTARKAPSTRRDCSLVTLAPAACVIDRRKGACLPDTAEHSYKTSCTIDIPACTHLEHTLHHMRTQKIGWKDPSVGEPDSWQCKRYSGQSRKERIRGPAHTLYSFMTPTRMCIKSARLPFARTLQTSCMKFMAAVFALYISSMTSYPCRCSVHQGSKESFPGT